MVIQSEYPAVEVLDVPIHDAVLGRAQEYGDRTALVDGVTGQEISYAQLDGMSRQVEFIDAVPKAASGKILRRELRAREATRE